MKTVLCIDNSGSTIEVYPYWRKVRYIREKYEPKRLIYWNTSSGSMERLMHIEDKAGGGTNPACFIPKLLDENETFDLIVTTDGEIGEREIAETLNKLEETKVFEKIKSVYIHYIGNLNHMNIGLNVIFSHYVKDVKFAVNDGEPTLVTDINLFERLSMEDVFSENFLVSLTTRIYNCKGNEEALNQLRGAICRLFGRLENSFETKSSDEFFEKDMRKEFVEYLQHEMEKVKPVAKLKSEALCLFDKKLDLSLSRLYATPKVEEKDLDLEDKPDNEIWEDLECSIIPVSFKLPCLLVKYVKSPFIINKKYHIHPFLVLSDDEIVDKILKVIEPNLIDYTTYQKLQYHNQCIISPFTRDECKGVFALDVTNMDIVRNNCAAISPLFSLNNKVPGNLVIWNLIFMYLICKYRIDDTEIQQKALQSIVNYCHSFKSNLSFTHYCMIFKSEKINLCFWFCLDVCPSVVPNTARNVMRSPFALELLELYLYIFHGRSTLTDLKVSDAKRKIELEMLIEKVKKWKVWNYLVSNKDNRADLRFEVLAQEQNYHELDDSNRILVSGKCQKPYKSVLNLVSPGLALALFNEISEKSSKTQNIDNIESTGNASFLTVKNFNIEELSHIKINIKTCWPSVICPVTKKHWKECAMPYEVKNGSLIRLFNRYCAKQKSYPSTPKDLIIFYNRYTHYTVFPENYLEAFSSVFRLFADVMSNYDIETYLLTYNKNIDEASRLQNE